MDNQPQPMENKPEPKGDQPQPGITGRIIFFIFLAVVLGAFWYFTRPEEATAPDKSHVATIGGQIVFVQGSVEYKSIDGVWKRASTSTELKAGDSVEVWAEGRAIINLDDGSALRLNNATVVTLTSLDPKHFIITNVKGQVYTRVAKSDRVFDVNIDGTTFEAAGTAYKTVNEPKLKGVEVYESKVKILGVGDKEILVDKGNKYYILNKDNKKAEKTFVKITNAEMSKDEFLKWNQTEDKKIAEETAVAETATSTETAETLPAEAPTSITLYAKKVSDGISLTWTVKDIDVSKGFKVVKGTAINPVYPGGSSIFISDSNVRSYKLAITDGKTYYFRVCQYQSDGSCGKYSNNVKITAPAAAGSTGSGAVTAIVLSSPASGKVVWRVTGYSAQGFKVVWSKTAHPTYPTRTGDKYAYYTSPQQAESLIDAFGGTGTYYVRVCEYLGGKCGLYSNEITVKLTADAANVNIVKSITLTSMGSGQVLWRADGTAENGFKVVWSKNAHPAYPTRDGDKYTYYTDPKETTGKVDAFDGTGLYYVRVCQYTGSVCGIYSNEIQVSL